MAFSPACRQYARALSHTSPRRAWCASRSTCSARRSPGERLEGLDDAGMQHPPPLLEQTAVGHLVGQGVLEGVLALGEEARLVEELGRLEVRQAAVQRLLGQLGNGLQQGQGHLRANDRGGLEQALLLRRQAVDARRQHRLHGGRHLNARQGLRQAIGASRRRPAPRSPPGSARSPPGRRDCPPCARSGAA